MEPFETFKETRGNLEVELLSDSVLHPGEVVGVAVGPCMGCEEITEGDYIEDNENDWWCGECWEYEKLNRAKARIVELEAEVEKLKGYPNSYSNQQGKSDEKLAWYEWYKGGDTGISSETIFQVMTGIPVKWTSTPMDSDDFGRCHRMLKRFPEWRDRLDEVSKQFPEWKQLIDNWSELESRYEDGNHNDVYLLIKRCCNRA